MFGELLRNLISQKAGNSTACAGNDPDEHADQTADHSGKQQSFQIIRFREDPADVLVFLCAFSFSAFLHNGEDFA